jgi:tRNA(Ile2) C34 agmatinyltransferase TiaS
MSKGEYRVGDYMSSPVMDYFEVNGFETLRRCPECKHRMRTNGHGVFWCACGYSDKQDVSKLLDTDLDYPVPTNSRTMRIYGWK